MIHVRRISEAQSKALWVLDRTGGLSDDTARMLIGYQWRSTFRVLENLRLVRLVAATGLWRLTAPGRNAVAMSRGGLGR